METATATPTTASTSTGTPSAAPATSAPSPSITPAERPTFAQAFASDAALHPSAPTDHGDAPATAAPVATEPASVTPTKPGEPPQEKWPQILENARKKSADEALATYRQQYGWAEQIPRAQLDAWVAQATRITNDPVGHIADIIAEVQSHPQWGPQLRSQAARLLASAKGPSRVDLDPDLVVRDEQGQVVEQSFSAKKMMAIVQQVVGDAVTPLKQESEQRRTDARHRAELVKAGEVKQQIEAKADTVMGELREMLDGNEALFEDVNTLMEQHPEWSAHKAALAVRKAKITPGLETKATQTALDQLKTKAAAQSVNPTGAVVSATHRPTSFHDKSLKW